MKLTNDERRDLYELLATHDLKRSLTRNASVADGERWDCVDLIATLLAQRPEASTLTCSKCGNALGCVSCSNERKAAPAQNSCDNSSEQRVISVPSCVPTPRTFTEEHKHLVQEAILAECKFTGYHNSDASVNAMTFSEGVIKRLDPPKTPQERIEAILSRRGYTWSQDDARSIAAEIVAALSKERP